MARYPNRPWYSPLGFMATTPHSYGFVVVTMGFFFGYPLRYKLGEYYERQQLTPDAHMRAKAIAYYRELERTQRRQAMTNHQMYMQADLDGHQMSATGAANSLKIGVTDYEYQYWEAHQRDALRAEKLLKEVEELQAKIQAA